MKATVLFLASSSALRFRSFNSISRHNAHSFTTHARLGQASPTVGQAYKQARQELESTNVEDADSSARYLTCHAANIGFRFSEFIRRMDEEMPPGGLSRLQSFLKRRSNREPVQYIIGNWDFFGLTFACQPPVLIPRPETEELVDLVIRSLAGKENASKPSLRFLDVGSGAGTLGIALMHALPASSCVAIDISSEAVALSKRNALNILGASALEACGGAPARYECHELSVQELQQQLGSPSPTWSPYLHSFDVIVSNPPYIPSEDLEGLQREVRDFEDWRALDGGAGGGLRVVRDILAAAPLLLRRSGRGDVWMEVHHSHPSILVEEAKLEARASPMSSMRLVDTYLDLSKQPRFVHWQSR